MVRQWQEMFYEERYSEVYCPPTSPTTWGGRSRWGVPASGIESTEEVASAIDKANSIDDRPVVIDFRTDAFEKVFPWWRPATPTTTSWSTPPSSSEDGR